MRLISFSLTERQLLDGSKTVTRRQVSPRSVWHKLKPGDQLRAVDKAMGLRPGQHPREIARMEKLDAMDATDCAREGFPEMTPHDFVDFFVRHMGCPRDQLVARIEFKRATPPQT